MFAVIKKYSVAKSAPRSPSFASLARLTTSFEFVVQARVGGYSGGQQKFGLESRSAEKTKHTCNILASYLQETSSVALKTNAVLAILRS